MITDAARFTEGRAVIAEEGHRWRPNQIEIQGGATARCARSIRAQRADKDTRPRNARHSSCASDPPGSHRLGSLQAQFKHAKCPLDWRETQAAIVVSSVTSSLVGGVGVCSRQAPSYQANSAVSATALRSPGLSESQIRPARCNNRLRRSRRFFLWGADEHVCLQAGQICGRCGNSRNSTGT